MIVEKLELKNFRNYENLEIDFSPDINILYGDNAQGKTNVLEAIYLCSTTKSYKGSKEKDMVKISTDESHLRMYIKKNGISHKTDMHLKTQGRKGVAVDGIPIKKSSDIYGLVNVIFFSPEDLSMIKNGPGERRKFMDAELCQINRLYLQYLSNYNKVLDQRNDLLKQMGNRRDLIDTLDIWDNQLIEYGSFIIEAREQFITDIDYLVKDIHTNISGGKEVLSCTYDPNTTKETFRDNLLKARERDIYSKNTSVGPHRDDISFFIGDENIKLFGSQGQQRTAALSLKLAEIELVKKKTGDNPILLLDDVLSELDRNRQHCLLDFINDIQTVITCTGLEEFVNNRSKINNLYKVTKGTIEKINSDNSNF